LKMETAQTSASGVPAAMPVRNVVRFMFLISITRSPACFPASRIQRKARQELRKRMNGNRVTGSHRRNRLIRVCENPRPQHFPLFWPVSGLTSQAVHLPMQAAQWY
jgi:hypothetical protein